jgi:hypothetical protein
LLDQPPPLPALRLDLPRAPLDARHLALVGTYSGNGGWELELAVADGQMRYRWADRWMPVTPTADGRLLLLPDSAMLTPRRAADGRIEGLAFSDGGEDIMLAPSTPH